MTDQIETMTYTIHWNDLGKYLKQGMKVITVMPGPGAETSMLAIVPEELAAELAKGSKSKKKISLRDILVDMAGWAAFRPGDVKRAKLAGGLGIDVIWGIDGMWRLQIWREGVQPSFKEWETVLKAWPEPLPAPAAEIPYKRFAHDKRQYMRGEWKVTIDQENNLPGGAEGRQESDNRDASTNTPAPEDSHLSEME